MQMGISPRRLRSMLKRLKPTPWSAYLGQPPKRRGRLFTMPDVEDLRVIRLAQQAIVRNIYRRDGSDSAARITFKELLADAGDRAAPAEKFDRTYAFYHRLCDGANDYTTGRDPDLEKRFPCWEIGAGEDSPLAALNRKRYRKSDPVWNHIFPPLGFGDNAWLEDSDGRQTKAPASLPERLCNPVDFLRAMNAPWWWPF